jgi:PAS domain S-box-containing protein
MVDDGVVGTDASFRITRWNVGAERLYGYTAEQVLGRPANQIATFTGDDQRERLERELLEHGRSRLEITAVRRDGMPIEIEIVVSAVYDDAGGVAGYLGIHRDVTERRRTARRLEQLSAVIGNAGDFIGFADLDGRVVSVNDAGLRLIGLHAGTEAQGRDIVEFVAEHDRVRARDDILPGVMRDGHREERLDLHDFAGGPPVPVSCHAFRVDEPATGRPIGIATISRDLRGWLEQEARVHDAERRTAEDSARRAEQHAVLARLSARATRTHDLAAFLDDAVVRIGRAVGAEVALLAELTSTGRFVVRSGAGIDPGSTTVVGTTDADDLFGRALHADAAVLTEDALGNGGVRVAPALRTLRPASCLVVPVAEGDDVRGALAVFSRASRHFVPPDHDFLESAAQVVSTALERSRTARRLEQAKDAERRRIAQALHDEALQDVRFALARAEAPSDGSEPDDLLVEALTRIGRELRSAVYDLRSDDEERSLEDLLTELVDLHRRMAPELRIDLHLGQLTERPPRSTKGDVLPILGEALTNVRRHANASRVKVRVWTAVGALWCDVSDDGRGMDTGTAPGTGVTGMRERAARYGGQMEIHAPDTGGTVVRVRLPLSPTRESGTPTRVLLVEDHAAVREAIATAFRREPDFEVAGEAATLAEAREQLDEVDVALVDLGLPDGDGSDLIAALREANPAAHAVVLSAGLDRSSIARAIERGAAGALAKSDRLPDVIDAVRRVSAGETLLPLEEVVELLRFASRERERELLDRRAIESLTSRELEILQLIADGCDSRQAASRLHISVRTQRNHVANVLGKLGVHSQLQALIFALRYQLVELRPTAS